MPAPSPQPLSPEGRGEKAANEEQHMMRSLLLALPLIAAAGCALTSHEVCEKVAENIILPEQRSIDSRDLAQFPSAHVPPTMPPRTVSDPRPDTPEWPMSLDEAIRIALENAQVIRVLA